MHHPTISLLLLALPLATATVASRSFFRRDFEPSQVPAQCQNTCAPLIAVADACATSISVVTCGGCTTKTEQYAVDCANCIVGLDPTLLFTEQMNVDEYIDKCELDGITLPPAKVSIGASTVKPSETITGNGGGGATTSNLGLNTNQGSPTPTSAGNTKSSSGGGSGASSAGDSNPLSGGSGSGLVGGASNLRALPGVVMTFVIGHWLMQTLCL